MNREYFINEKVREHYVDVPAAYKAAAVLLQGSQNYDLDVYTEDYQSDIDTKAIIIPTLDQIVNNSSPVSTTFVREDNSHIDCKDVRVLFDNFKKCNVNFLEVLFTEYKVIDGRYINILSPIFENREMIAKHNMTALFKSMCGMICQKHKALCHPYPAIKHKIEKYGFDPKQLHHCFRMEEMSRNLLDMSFQESLKSENPKFLIDVKMGKIFNLKEALECADECVEKVRKIKDKVLEECFPIDIRAYELLNDVKSDLIRASLKEEINGK